MTVPRECHDSATRVPRECHMRVPPECHVRVPPQCHESAARVPRECRHSATRVPPQCRESAATVPRECRHSATRVPRECRHSASGIRMYDPVLKTLILAKNHENCNGPSYLRYECRVKKLGQFMDLVKSYARLKFPKNEVFVSKMHRYPDPSLSLSLSRLFLA